MIKILKTNGAKGQKERERIKEERPTDRQTSGLNDRKKKRKKTKEQTKEEMEGKKNKCKISKKESSNKIMGRK